MLLASIHDVAPPFLSEAHELWTMCRRQGLTPALLVVPDWHGAAPLAQSPEMIRWIRDRHREGADILLHGERHDEVGTRRSIPDWWRAAGRTAREGEFLTLGMEQASARIERGVHVLRALGFDPVGFVPPAWLARRAHRRAVRRAGLLLTEDAAAIWRLGRQDERLPSTAIRWSARTRWRALCSSMLAEWRAGQHGPGLLRLALHPTDLHVPRTRRSVARVLAGFEDRCQTSYRTLAYPNDPEACS